MAMKWICSFLIVILAAYLLGANWYENRQDHEIKRYEDEQVTCRVLVWSYYGVAISCVKK